MMSSSIRQTSIFLSDVFSDLTKETISSRMIWAHSAFGKPILSTPLPEVAALKTRHVLFYHDTSELANFISKVLKDSSLSERMAKEARRFAEEHDLNVIAKRLESILLENLEQ